MVAANTNETRGAVAAQALIPHEGRVGNRRRGTYPSAPPDRTARQKLSDAAPLFPCTLWDDVLFSRDKGRAEAHSAYATGEGGEAKRRLARQQVKHASCHVPTRLEEVRPHLAHRPWRRTKWTGKETSQRGFSPPLLRGCRPGIRVHVGDNPPSADLRVVRARWINWNHGAIYAPGFALRVNPKLGH